MLLAGGLESQSGYSETAETGWDKDTSDLQLNESSHLANTMYDRSQLHPSIGPCDFVCRRELQQNTAMRCLPMVKMEATGQLLPSVARVRPVCLFASNNTITQLKMHSRQLQTTQLYAKHCIIFILSPEALVLEYSRIPP